MVIRQSSLKVWLDRLPVTEHVDSINILVRNHIFDFLLTWPCARASLTHTHTFSRAHTSCPFPSRNHVYLSFFTLKHYCRMERPFHNTIIPLHTNSYSFFTVCENLGVEFVYIKHNYLVRLIHNNSWATVSLISNYSLSHSLLYIARFIAIWS